MRRDVNSNRSAKWLLRNSLEYSQNKEYIVKLLDEYDINEYEIKPFKDGILGLYIYRNEFIYILYVDSDWMEIKVICSEDNYKRFICFTGDVAWRKSIESVVVKS